MSRNSIEAKFSFQQRKFNKTKYNPQSTTNIFPSYSPVTKGLKRCQSAVSIRNKSQKGQLDNLQIKYRLLEQNYQNLFQQTVSKAQNFKKQKREIEQLQELHELYQKEIKILKGRLGFLNHEDQGVQTNLKTEISEKQKMSKTNHTAFRTNNDKWAQKTSYRDKKIANTFYKEREKVYEQIKRKSQNKIPSKSRIKQNFSRYKFVPTLPLK